MLNVAFDFVLSTVFVKQIRIYYNKKITKTFFFSQPVFWYVVLFDEIDLHDADNTFLIYFVICIKHTLSAIILKMEKSHLIFELHYKKTFLWK